MEVNEREFSADELAPTSQVGSSRTSSSFAEAVPTQGISHLVSSAVRRNDF